MGLISDQTWCRWWGPSALVLSVNTPAFQQLRQCVQWWGAEVWGPNRPNLRLGKAFCSTKSHFWNADTHTYLVRLGWWNNSCTQRAHPKGLAHRKQSIFAVVFTVISSHMWSWYTLYASKGFQKFIVIVFCMDLCSSIRFCFDEAEKGSREKCGEGKEKSSVFITVQRLWLWNVKWTLTGVVQWVELCLAKRKV